MNSIYMRAIKCSNLEFQNTYAKNIYITQPNCCDHQVKELLLCISTLLIFRIIELFLFRFCIVLCIGSSLLDTGFFDLFWSFIKNCLKNTDVIKLLNFDNSHSNFSQFSAMKAYFLTHYCRILTSDVFTRQ